MSRKIIVSLILLITLTSLFPTKTAVAGRQSSRQKTERFAGSKFNLANWLIEDETSVWSDEELEVLTEILIRTIGALDQAGLDGTALLEGYRFRRWDGEFAKDKQGKIAVVNHTNMEIVLSDTILAPENYFFIYHELGHVVNRRTGDALSSNFHALTEAIEGVVVLHDWTTAEGFWIRGQSHVKRSEAIADAFALWVLVGYARLNPPVFHDTPESARPEAIISVFEQAVELTFGN